MLRWNSLIFLNKGYTHQLIILYQVRLLRKASQVALAVLKD